MKLRGEHFTGPLFASFTLLVGIGCVAGIGYLASLFSEREPAIVQSSEPLKPATYDFFSAPKVAPEEPVYPKELSCYDLTILPIWNVLKNDEQFKERVGYSDDSPDCSEMLEIERVDLNRDGRKEILVRGKNFHLCSGVGNCAFWVLEEGRTRPRVLLSSSDYADVSDVGEQVLKTRSNGYSDLLVRGHFSAAETGHYTYKFDGKKYVEAKCMYEVPMPEAVEPVAWEMITCEEFNRRSEKSTKGAK